MTADYLPYGVSCAVTHQRLQVDHCLVSYVAPASACHPANLAMRH